jgi:hypothetical protein
VLVVCRRLRLSATTAALAGGIACLSLRLVSVWLNWQLPGSAAAH